MDQPARLSPAAVLRDHLRDLHHQPTITKYSCRNYATRGFWHFLRNHYGADYIVAEAKSVTSPVDKIAVLQLANYLSRHGTGLFGMLLTRHGLNENAQWTRREHWVLHNKMIIGLDDEDMQQMLLTKLAGNKPEVLIQ